MTLNPEQLRALQSSILPAHEAAQELGADIETIELFESNVKNFIRIHHKSLKGHAYQFVLDFSQHGKTSLSLSTVRDLALQGKTLMYVDASFRLIKLNGSLKNTTEFSRILYQEKYLGFFIDGTYFWEFLCARLIDEGDLITGHDVLNLSTGVPRWPMKDFGLLLKDHYAIDVKSESTVDYWKDKLNRILLCGPHGTEWIFQKALYSWLNKFVIDKLRIYAEPCGLGQDKHDITVVTEKGTYVIEVKWLGKNEKNNSYGQDRINEGLVQLKEYLTNDESLCRGFLVAYDGRLLNDHNSKSSHDEKFRHPNCERPNIIFLESESPSKKAVRIVKESKKNDPANK
jgi:hypothetical protein